MRINRFGFTPLQSTLALFTVSLQVSNRFSAVFPIRAALDSAARAFLRRARPHASLINCFKVSISSRSSLFSFIFSSILVNEYIIVE